MDVQFNYDRFLLAGVKLEAIFAYIRHINDWLKGGPVIGGRGR